jgi:hypothetical protein
MPMSTAEPAFLARWAPDGPYFTHFGAPHSESWLVLQFIYVQHSLVPGVVVASYPR